jgi:hypothetical protein
MATLREIVDRIQVIAPKISSEPLSGARYSPEPAASATQCFSNAQRKAQQSGGGALYGWMFHYREATALAGQAYILAVNHAVWHAPDKKLIDVTPFHDNPHHRPVVVNGPVTTKVCEMAKYEISCGDVRRSVRATSM